jgi:hypothetical protein
LQRSGQRNSEAGTATTAKSGEAGPHYSVHDTSAQRVPVPAVRPRVHRITGPLCVSGHDSGTRPFPVVRRPALPHALQPSGLR